MASVVLEVYSPEGHFPVEDPQLIELGSSLKTSRSSLTKF